MSLFMYDICHYLHYAHKMQAVQIMQIGELGENWVMLAVFGGIVMPRYNTGRAQPTPWGCVPVRVSALLETHNGQR